MLEVGATPSLMSSKLFHTVVAFGITLGAASVGCSAEAVDAPASSEAAVITADDKGATDTKVDTAKTEPAKTAAPGLPTDVEKDRFCEVAWPTTKGGPRPDIACADPQHQCGTYPTTNPDLAELGLWYGAKSCYRVEADGTTCNSSEVWMFCKDTTTSHEWACPKGTIEATQCVWPTPDNSGNTTTERPERGNGEGAYGANGG